MRLNKLSIFVLCFHGGFHLKMVSEQFSYCRLMLFSVIFRKYIVLSPMPGIYSCKMVFEGLNQINYSTNVIVMKEHVTVQQ